MPFVFGQTLNPECEPRGWIFQIREKTFRRRDARQFLDATGQTGCVKQAFRPECTLALALLPCELREGKLQVHDESGRLFPATMLLQKSFFVQLHESRHITNTQILQDVNSANTEFALDGVKNLR